MLTALLAHRAYYSVVTLQAGNVFFYLTRFVASNSYDLNIIYCKVIQQQVRQSRLYNISELKPHFLRVWRGVGDSIIYDATMH